MIKKIITSSHFLLPRLSHTLTPNHFSLQTRFIMFFSSNKIRLPKNKQEAWMMQEQQNANTSPFVQEGDQETYSNVTKFGISAFIMLAGFLCYMFYSASKKGQENLDLIQENITGLREIKQKDSILGGEWTLINSQGQPFSNRNLEGYYYLIYFGYTSCPEICPSTLYYLSSVYRIIRNIPQGAYMKLKVVFVSIDPERDTPKVLKKYLGQFGKHIIGLTCLPNDKIELEECMKKFKIFSKKIKINDGKKKDGYDFDHTTRVCLMDQSNKFIYSLDPHLTEQQTAKAIVAKVVASEHFKDKAEEKLTQQNLPPQKSF